MQHRNDRRYPVSFERKLSIENNRQAQRIDDHLPEFASVSPDGSVSAAVEIPPDVSEDRTTQLGTRRAGSTSTLWHGGVAKLVGMAYIR